MVIIKDLKKIIENIDWDLANANMNAKKNGVLEPEVFDMMPGGRRPSLLEHQAKMDYILLKMDYNN
jgi:hypothetical protein